MIIKTLDPQSPLYSSVNRALFGHPFLPQMYDSGALETAVGLQPWHYAVTTGVTGATWSADQGIHKSDEYWFAADTTTLEKYNFSGDKVEENSNPFAGMGSVVDHCGDIFEHNGIVYVAICDWDGDNQSATEVYIGMYNSSDLSPASPAFFDVSAQASGTSGLNGSGVALNGDGTEILVCSYYRGGGVTDARTKEIYRYALADGAYIGKLTLPVGVEGIQGIAVGDGLLFLASHDSEIYGTIKVNDLTTLVQLTSIDPIDFSTKIEGVCYKDGRLFSHALYGSPVEVTPLGVIIGKRSGKGSAFQIAASDQLNVSEGTILLNVSLFSLYNYNSLIDNINASNDWESWVYDDGRIAWRTNSGNSIISSSGTISANTDYVIGFTWDRGASTTTIKLWLDGASLGTSTGSNNTFPADGFSLGGANDGNDSGDLWAKDIFVLDRALNDTELGVYTTAVGVASLYSTSPFTPEPVNTPINPSITSLLATSARLNWEQG